MAHCGEDRQFDLIEHSWRRAGTLVIIYRDGIVHE